MNDSEYIEYWKKEGESLFTFPKSTIANSTITKTTNNFLTNCGFPISIAPFLSFSVIKEAKFMSVANEFDIKELDLDHYFTFGFNGSGDPICIDTSKNDQIVYLNHDNNFERIFINDEVEYFGYSLILYHNFFKSIISDKLDDFSKRKFSNEEFDELKDKFIANDPKSLDKYSFWQLELDALLEERDNA